MLHIWQWLIGTTGPSGFVFPATARPPLDGSDALLGSIAQTPLSWFWLFPLLLAVFFIYHRRERRHWNHRILLLQREKRAERTRLAAAQRRCDDLADMVTDLVVEVDENDRITFLGDGARQALDLERMRSATGPSILRLLRSDQVKAWQRFAADLRTGQRPAADNFVLVGSEGVNIPVRAVARAVVQPDGTASSTLQIVFIDQRPELETRRASRGSKALELTAVEILDSLDRAVEGKLDEAFAEGLVAMGGFTSVDRFFMLRLAEDNSALEWQYQWCAQGVEPIPQDHHLRSIDELPWAGEHLLRGEVVHVEDVAALPVQAAVEKERWLKLGVRSLLAVPMFRGGRLVGLLAFNAMYGPGNWQEEDVRLLSTVARILAGAWLRQQTERELKAANQRLADIIEFLPDAMFVIDNRRRVVAWNRALEDLSGVPKADMIGRGDHAYAVPFYGKPVPILIDYVGQDLREPYSERYEYIETQRDTLCAEAHVPQLLGGKGAQVWLTASPLFDSEGNMVGAIESIRNITQRKQAQQALRKSEEDYRRLVETMNDGMVVIDAEGRVTYVNQRLCHLVGYESGELIGSLIDDYLPDRRGESRVAAWSGWRAESTRSLETEIARKDGSILPVRVSPSPLLDEQGQFRGGFAIISDMTDIRAAEARITRLNENLEQRVLESTHELTATNQALRRSEARYRRLIENLEEGYIFYSHDRDMCYTYISPSFRHVLGYDSLDAVLEHLRLWIDQPINARARSHAEKSSLGFKQPAYDLHVQHIDGSSVVLEILEVPVFDEAGLVVAVEGIARDVTETRRNIELIRNAQDQLVEAEKMAALGRLVAGLSHEINTPMGISVTASSHLSQLIGECFDAYASGTLKRGDFESFLETSRETADLIQGNLNRASDLVVNFKQVAADQSAGQERTFDLGGYLQEVIQSLSPQTRNTGFNVTAECPSDLTLHCDPGALYQVLSNLLMNSLIHGFDGLLVGEVRIEAQREGAGVVIEYSDNGNGMTRGQLAQIYEPFFTTRRGRGGTGLGMHIVYNNVTQTLGGTISCASKPGQGTRFRITLPLLAEVQHG